MQERKVNPRLICAGKIKQFLIFDHPNVYSYVFLLTSETQSYIVDAIVNLLREAEPKPIIVDTGSRSSSDKMVDKESAEEKVLNSRYAVLLLKELCDPQANLNSVCTHYILYKLTCVPITCSVELRYVLILIKLAYVMITCSVKLIYATICNELFVRNVSYDDSIFVSLPRPSFRRFICKYIPYQRADFKECFHKILT